MPTSAYFSDVKVEIAFDSGFSTPAASRTWTDVSQWVELDQGMTIGHGRGDERSQADANTLSLTLDNSDGRFTPGRTAGAYYPNVRLYRPIRVTATPPASAASIRFTGFINQWQAAWDGSDEASRVQVAAASRLSRLGLSDVRVSTVEETANLLGAPRAYFTLGEPADSTRSVNSSGVTTFPLRARGPAPVVVYGGAPSTPYDSLTGATFTAGGQYLVGNQAGGVVQSSSTAFTLSCFYSRGAGVVAANGYLMFLRNTSGSHEVSIQTVPTGTILSPVGNSIVGYFDDVGSTALNHVALVYDSAASPNVKLYRNGALIQSYTTGYSATNLTELSVGGSALAGGNLDGTVSHVAVFPSALSAVEVSTLNAAGRTGFSGQGTGAFLQRFASWSGIPVGEIVTTGTDRTLLPIDSTGATTVDLMRQVEQSEVGVLYDQRGGNLALVPDSSRYTATSAFTLDMAQQQVEGDFSPSLDPSSVINTVTVTQVGGDASGFYMSQVSRDENGVASESLDTYSTNPDDATQLATWRVGRYAEPRNRVPSLSVDVVAQTGATPSPATILAADVGTMFTVANQPAQAEASTGTYFVEGYTETFGPESHVISFNVSPAALWTSTLAFNDAARGFNSGAVFAF